MAFPSVVAVAETAISSAGTSHVVNLPNGATGNLLLAIMDKGSTAATVNALAGWTELLDENLANGLYIAYRVADGTEGATTTFTLSAATRGAWLVYEISGAENPATQAPQIGTTASGSNFNPDAPAVTPTGGAKDYLWITFFGAAGEEADDDTWASVPPTNYTPNPQYQKACGTAGTNLGGMIASSWRQLNAASENPPLNAQAVSAAWRAQTIAVHPAPSGTAHTVNPADSISVSDSMSFDNNKTIAESLAFSDSLVFDREMRLSDTLSLSDQISFTREISLGDAFSLADQISPELGRSVSLNDSIVLSDSMSSEIGRGISINDSISLADAIEFRREMYLSDSLSVSDATKFDRAISVAEAIAIADSIAFQRELTLSEVVSLADLVDPVLTQSQPTNHEVGVNDTVSLGDALSFIREVLLTDSVVIQDSNARQLNGLFLPDGSVAVATKKGIIVIGRF